MAPTYAPMIPPQAHHIVQYGNMNPSVAPTPQQQQPLGGHMSTPNPNSNTIPYYHHHPTQPQQHSTPPPPPHPHSQQRQSSPGSHSSASGKKPNLRVEIPSETQNNETATTTTTAAATTTTTTTAVVVAANGPPPTVSSFAPPSALPSQFAHNLPSPSTFYPEFYQQNELPSPLNFSSTPISGGTSFHWPSRASISGPGGTEYKPSPLAKM